MDRRTFLATAAGVAVSPLKAAMPATIIDTHTHFYDPTRLQGVPWPPKTDNILYRPVLPAEFVKLTRSLGITGTIEVEASQWLEDNQWVLDLAAGNPIIVGTVGDLEPGKPDFRKNLARFHKNPLFRGIRLGTSLLDRSLGDLKALAEAGLELDAIGGPPLLPHVVRLTDEVPDLRIVINHLPFDPPADEAARAVYQAALRTWQTSAGLRQGV